jgi:hypothetical protein
MTTTAKDTKPSALEELKIQAEEIAKKIKDATDATLAELHVKLGEAHKAVQSITAEIRSHGGKPPSTGAKRGRKAGKATVKKTKVTRGKRGALGEGILKFLQSKGGHGAHVKDIATALKTGKGNVTSWFYTTGKKIKGIKHVGPGTFAYSPKS